MKLGIFGDSYGDYNHYPIPEGTPVHAWPRILATDYNINVDNFCKGGVDIIFVYKTFLQHYQQYDKIIVTIPNLKRRVIFKTDKFIDDGDLIDNLDNFSFKGMLVHKGENIAQHYIEHMSGKKHSEKYWENYWNKIKPIQEDFRTLWTEYGYATEQLIAYAIKGHMQSLKPDIIFLPSFNSTTRSSLNNISKLDFIKFSCFKEIPFKRYCHLSFKQNYELAKYLNDAVTKDWNVNQTLKADNIPQFYTASNTIEEAGLGEISPDSSEAELIKYYKLDK